MSILPLAVVAAAIMLIGLAREVFLRKVVGLGGYGAVPGWGAAILVLALFSGAMLTWNVAVEPSVLWAAVWAIPTLIAVLYVLLSWDSWS